MPHGDPSHPSDHAERDGGLADTASGARHELSGRAGTDAILAALRGVTGLSATASDVLDDLAFDVAVSATDLPARTHARNVVGYATTLRYLPARRPAAHGIQQGENGLIHQQVFDAAAPGDVLVIDATAVPGVSTLGGMGAAAAVRAHMAAVISDGGVRDLDQLRASGLPVWSRTVTPVTGKWRVEAAAIGDPVCCGGVQVRAGDLVLADETGICFVPSELAGDVAARVLEVSASEAASLAPGDAR